MKTVIIVSKCLRVTQMNHSEAWYHFHFKGVCSGEALKKVLLHGSKELNIEMNQEYLIFVQLISIDQGVLKGKIIKIRPLDECWDKS